MAKHLGEEKKQEKKRTVAEVVRQRKRRENACAPFVPSEDRAEAQISLQQQQQQRESVASQPQQQRQNPVGAVQDRLSVPRTNFASGNFRNFFLPFT
ncbi:hypothetical protein ABEB36_011944 [Hypothenemus hampei]|uniref:Small vasohibin-binding protein n=1 Tax=Hypothenemus hampei TaxID=57062 RepID=A0ABD1EA95_HYPHA